MINEIVFPFRIFTAFGITSSKEISSNASIIITLSCSPGNVSSLFVWPMLNKISAPNTFAPLELRSHVPHVVSAKTKAGISNSFVIFVAVC